MAGNYSRTTKEVWDKIQLDYFAGNFRTLKELASKYDLPERSVRNKICHNSWNRLKEERQRALLSKVNEIKESEAEKYLKSTLKRVFRYEKIIDASLDNLGSKTSDGTPLLDPEAINDYTIAEQRIHALGKSALMIPDASRNVDITSKGQSLGESLVSAIAKVRESESGLKITSQDVDRIIEAEIIEDDGKAI